jgi:H+/Cl- antiporter ClcA
VLGAVIALLAIGFAAVTGHDAQEVLFSGQSALPALVTGAAGWSAGAVILLLVCKSLAYGISLSGWRGGPVFPSMFIGAAIGVAMASLPGMSLVPGVAMGIGAMCVSVLRLPFTSVLLATVLLANDGLAVMPLVIVSVVVAHVLTAWLPRAGDLRHRAPVPATA